MEGAAGVEAALADTASKLVGTSQVIDSGEVVQGKKNKKEVSRLFQSTQTILESWTAHLLAANVDRFPEKVTAFREGMAVHGRFGKPCPICETVVQRIVYAENETNYCPRCQTEGKLLADRSLSRLLKKDWPRTIDEWES